MCWAGNIVLAKGVATLIPPTALAFWRWFVAFLILLPLTWPYVKRDWDTALAGWKILALLALFGVTSFNTLLYMAMHTTTAINGALIQTTMPAVIIVISLVLYGERISWIQAAGVTLCVIGAGVVVLKGRWQSLIDMALVHGDLLMIVAVFLYALYSALLPKRPNMHPMSFLTYTFGMGCLGLLPLYLWEMSAVGTFTYPRRGRQHRLRGPLPIHRRLFLLEPGGGRDRCQPHRPVHQPDSRFCSHPGHHFSGRILRDLPSDGYGPDPGGVCYVQPVRMDGFVKRPMDRVLHSDSHGEDGRAMTASTPPDRKKH